MGLNGLSLQCKILTKSFLSISWMGFNTKCVALQHRTRQNGLQDDVTQKEAL